MVSSATLREPVTKRGPGCRDPNIGEAVYPELEYKTIPLRRIPFYHHPATTFTLSPKRNQMMSKKNLKKGKNKVLLMPIMQSGAAGIDISSSEIYIAVHSNRSDKPVRRFDTFTDDLHQVAWWLKDCNIKSIAMESTGVCWVPVFQISDFYGFEVIPVNARHVKNVPGRKTDVLDC